MKRKPRRSDPVVGQRVTNSHGSCWGTILSVSPANKKHLKGISVWVRWDGTKKDTLHFYSELFLSGETHPLRREPYHE